MIRHLVFFKLADQAEGNTKAINVLSIKQQLEGLKSVIPVIRKIEVHSNHPQAASSNWDIVLDTEFDTLEDLNVYAEHPEHLKIAEFIAKVKTDRAAIDYEI